jgi:hypothetical protein
MSRLAITNALGHVVQFVRADVPPGWQPPPGHKAVPEASLPVGYKMAAATPRPVPESITAVQARHWMIRKGIYPKAVDDAIARIADTTDRELVKAWWEYEIVLRRAAVPVERFRVALGMTVEQLDDAFREAAEIAG